MKAKQSISRDALLSMLQKDKVQGKEKELIQLRLQYSHIHTLRDTFIESLTHTQRIYPVILPTQASGRWSYINPPLSGFSKVCINPQCPQGLHEKTTLCWSIQDCLRPDKGTFWIDHDLDAVEHRIYALLLGWDARIQELKRGIDIHTPVACTLFHLPVPRNLYNPHTSTEDRQWRQDVQWAGKDDQRRTIGKNMTYGSQYFYVSLDTRGTYKPKPPYRVYQKLIYNPMFVYSIPNIESFRIQDTDGHCTTPNYIDIAIHFIESNVEVQKRKALEMEKIRKDKVARTLYGGRRLFYFQNQQTAKEGFNHRIQGTVASYINESCILLQKEFPTSYIVHNKHDSLKWAFVYENITDQGRKEEEAQVLERVKQLTQRDLIYEERSIPITATYKIIHREDI
jgi:DNA polymerase I-like protein with 3'-5' exonuclease and polymerase domains